MDLQVFNTPDEYELRTITIAGEPWFIARDICFTLGLGNVSQAVTRLDPDERQTLDIGVASNDTQLVAVSESGLYALILGSRKPEAKDFKRWVTKEVLPTIRKTGNYMAAPVPELSRLDLAKMILDAETRNEEKDRIIEQQKPAVAFVEALVDTTSLTTLSDAAKEFGYGPKEFTAILVGRKILFRRTKSGPLIARQEHLDAGRFAVKVWMGNGYTKPNTHLTAKGLVWLKGVIPTATTDTFWDLEA